MNINEMTQSEINRARQISAAIQQAGYTSEEQLKAKKFKLDNGHWVSMKSILVNRRARPVIVSNGRKEWAISVDHLVSMISR